ncbi:methionyl-tRNA formyltransferase [Siccirubricoccus deserti]|uniref:Methionyl-tRNA formyltransferase n=1 Tax=Siccirubricoccus deserti TaxID=2013562 RepID=A0A9X0QXA3_9PROT|nr:methionyl-tRNA formyltransferase [Siccirubricoccus deserti]MBC4015529.1 methionyl-tRNA formyltransferase [Siccirubricoccus deserti]GGC42463.1 methionyl-tRNA formyltransferase [Siccirubricoccus deserti]
MKLGFMGSPDFAVPALRALHAAGHEIAVVYCQPPRPAGRGQKETPCPVHRTALALGLPVRTPARLRRDAGEHAAFDALGLDAAVVAAYGLILPKPMLEAPRRGCLNIHASLLPRWRGAAPIQAAILAGDAESGVTIMQMEEGLDTGPMLLRGTVPLGPRITTPQLHDALSEMGAALVLRALAEDPPAVPQPDDGVTYAPKLTKADALLDWAQPAAALDARIRALNPWPGTYFMHQGEAIRVLAAEPAEGAGPPGTMLDAAGLVGCGTGALRLLRLQRPGRGPLPAGDFLRGFPLPAGTTLG